MYKAGTLRLKNDVGWDNIKMIFRKMDSEDGTWMELAQISNDGL
jgi:hypothetical protein